MSERVLMALTIAVIVTILSASGLAVLNSDREQWVETEDPACYLHVIEHKSLAFNDYTTRVRYCRVKE